jgi:hypothetical protein
MSRHRPISLKTVNDITVKVYSDDSPSSPRENDNLGTIVTGKLRSYNLGEKPNTDVEEIKAIMADKNNICLPVYMYEHSSVALRTSDFEDRWDSGQVGIIYVTKEKARKDFMVKRLTKKTIEKVLECLKSEIEIYSQYVNGDVYGYVVEDANGEEIDSCWGYYDDPVAIIEEQLKAHGAYDSLSVKVMKDLGGEATKG